MPRLAIVSRIGFTAATIGVSLTCPWADARGITKDIAAVRADVTAPRSNGQTEGHVNRLKLVKRQMYGRARLDLLEACLIGAP